LRQWLTRKAKGGRGNASVALELKKMKKAQVIARGTALGRESLMSDR
jgi:hypothetical protein